jgi:hypothetical protein
MSVGLVLLMTRNIKDDMFVPLVSVYMAVGYNFARTMGSTLTDFANIQSKTKPCNMDNYWLLNLVCNALFPIILVPLIFILVPSFKISGGKKNESKEELLGI